MFKNMAINTKMFNDDDCNELMRLFMIKDNDHDKMESVFCRIKLKNTLQDSYIELSGNLIKFFILSKKQKKKQLIKLLDKLKINIFIFKIIKLLLTQFNIFIEVLHHTDTHLITANILTQNTYYKTLTSRP
jgi:hypothetical protein